MTLPRFGEVLKKLKKYWQWAATGVVVLLAFILGRRGKSSAVRSAKDIAALKNKEIEIINKSNEKEEARKMAARNKLIEENVTLGIKVGLTILVIMAALFGVALYLRLP